MLERALYMEILHEDLTLHGTLHGDPLLHYRETLYHITRIYFTIICRSLPHYTETLTTFYKDPLVQQYGAPLPHYTKTLHRDPSPQYMETLYYNTL